jgi:hypothetical protein
LCKHFNLGPNCLHSNSLSCICRRATSRQVVVLKMMGALFQRTSHCLLVPQGPAVKCMEQLGVSSNVIHSLKTAPAKPFNPHHDKVEPLEANLAPEAPQAPLPPQQGAPRLSVDGYEIPDALPTTCVPTEDLNKRYGLLSKKGSYPFVQKSPQNSPRQNLTTKH